MGVIDMYENHILEEIYKNSNTGIYSIDTLIEKIDDVPLYDQLKAHQQKLQSISERSEKMLIENGVLPPETSAMSKVGIWTGVQWNTLTDDSASHIADMVIEGDTMGITSLTKELNSHPVTNAGVRNLAQELLSEEHTYIEQMKQYL